MRLLIVDDDMKFCRLISNYFAGFGIDVSAVHNGNDAVEAACGDKWDAIILDVMLPGNDGFAILRRLRERANGTPVLMLTALGEETDRIVGLELGADDYIAKTCSPRELLARLRAVLRRARSNVVLVDKIVAGPLIVNPASRLAVLNDEPLQLTPVEFDLLLVLAQAKGLVKSREELINGIRDRNYDVLDRSIDVHVSSLRRKLGDDPRNPRFIRTVRAAGYTLIDPSEKA
jgi:DNA-binding response OmpR family regulator